MKVMKFGGSSLKDGQSMLNVGEIIASDSSPRVVVVSAVQGTTDQLIDFISEFRSEKEVQEFVDRLKDKHLSFLKEVTRSMDTKQEAVSVLMKHLVKLERVLYGISYLEEITERTRDLVQSFGERMSVVLVAYMLRDMGVNSVPLQADELGIVTDGVYGQSTANLVATEKNIRSRIEEMIGEEETPVITGFFGRTPDGHVSVFGRNGTDYSASVIASVLDADTLEIWKDVDGFMSVDPRFIPQGVTIDRLSYDEAAELSYFGAQVLHPRTVEPARAKNIIIKVKNVFKPEKEGTIIGPSKREAQESIKSISCMDDLAIIKVFGMGAGYRSGVMSDISLRLREEGFNIYSAATSQTCISLLVDQKNLDKGRRALENIESTFIERIEEVKDVALLCVVGEGLGFKEGIAARIFKSVAEENVNVNMISAGASMAAYCFTVDKKDLKRTTRAIHDEFFDGGGR